VLDSILSGNLSPWAIVVIVPLVWVGVAVFVLKERRKGRKPPKTT